MGYIKRVLIFSRDKLSSDPYLKPVMRSFYEEQLTRLERLQYISRGVYITLGVHLNEFKIRVILAVNNKAKRRTSLELYCFKCLPSYPLMSWSGRQWACGVGTLFQGFNPGCLIHWEQNLEVFELCVLYSPLTTASV